VWFRAYLIVSMVVPSSTALWGALASAEPQEPQTEQEQFAPGGSGVAVKAVKDGAMITVDASWVAPGPRDLVWQVLTDYDGMPRFVDGLESSRVLERTGNLLTVEQAGHESFGPFSFEFSTLREIELIPHEEIRSHLLQGGSLEHSETVTRLAPRLDETEVTYHASFRQRGLPPLLGLYAVEQGVRRQLEQIRAEIRRRSAVKSPPLLP
jgi:uncharacterized membrane protein